MYIPSPKVLFMHAAPSRVASEMLMEVVVFLSE